MASSYYDSTGKNVSDGDTAIQADVNNINAAVDSGFQAVEADLNDAQTGVIANKEYSEEWAVKATAVSVAAGGDGATTFSAKKNAEDAAADVVSTNADVVTTGNNVTAAELAETNAVAAAAILPAPVALKAGALIVQNTDDANFDLLTTQGTSGHPLVSKGADVTPVFEQVASEGLATDSVTAAKVLANEGILNSELLPATTSMVFYQASAPTGWTQSTANNDRALRVVSGTGGGTGGATAFSTAFTHTHTDTLAGPAHDHKMTISGYTSSGSSTAGKLGVSDPGVTNGAATTPQTSAASSTVLTGAVTSKTIDPKYIDVIVATKD